ncbi:Cation efflux system protein CusA [BD1-7 clade bacterium]|uniref:Cation efflux system protein CusA n=1 Tax=BD1-7 clade bacterium TaxID=2029982 RepID=A0A5S9PNG3_9GAMM|nr:Cation efflux system protein CusA [BD1-7 clade bacterium]CAA0106014.1 Cation efflux system protein CusA [BD1-7 clade bacterium]
MISRLIAICIEQRVLVLIAAMVLVVAGMVNLRSMPVDALPDLSDVQVIVKTPYPGQAPQVVEDQVTYPLSTAMLSVPGAVDVRGYSFFGDSYIYVIFADKTDLYWARSRVLEYLNQVADQLPDGVNPALGPDATGVGWVYEYALVDRTGKHDISQLRSIQDWFLKFELQTVEGVAEVASVGGMVKQYQIEVDPDRLAAFDLTLEQLRMAVQAGNQEIGGSVIEMAETEFMVRATGYIDSLDDIRQIPLSVNDKGTPVLVGDVATVKFGPELRRGIAELNGEGEVAGGIIVMRKGANAQSTIAAVKTRITELTKSLPDGVEIIPTYDRSDLIERSIDNLYNKLVEEFIVVALVCALFLFHFRSSLVIVITLPLGILAALMIMRAQGLNANIMSLGGIAIAIGAMVDGAIVMVENLHRHIEHNPERARHDHWGLVREAASEVGAPLFLSLMIITLSFLPVFTLQAQEGRLFAPLAFTKTWAMAVSAMLSVTLVPVLMGFLIRGRITRESKNPVNRFLIRCYLPVIHWATGNPRWVIAIGIVAMLSVAWPWSKLGTEFMPPLDEGDWMYMPTTRPGLSIGEAAQLLQQTDRLIKSVPEVAQVFGKIGRADTATDPAPLTMIETLIRFKPEAEWRPGMTKASIREEIKQRVNVPGITNAWVMPIKTRIDMQATGVKTPVGIKIAGPRLPAIQGIGKQVETLLKDLPGTASVYAERVAGGRYVVADIKRDVAARFGLNIDDVQLVVSTAIGGRNITETVEGLERYPVNMRYPRKMRESVEAIRNLPIITPDGARIRLADVADIRIEDGPPMIKSENARPAGWVFVDINDIDIGTYVENAKAVLEKDLDLPAGYSISWEGQYQYLERAKEKLQLVIPLTVLIITLLLYLAFRDWIQVLVIMATLPMSLVGSTWLLYGLGYELSVAVAVGMIALAGVAVEIGVIMMIYLNQFRDEYLTHLDTRVSLVEIVQNAAIQRLRPIVMTVVSTSVGLLPIMFSDGTGSEVMQRIAAPMIGGMVSTLALTLMVLPAVYLLVERARQRG